MLDSTPQNRTFSDEIIHILYMLFSVTTSKTEKKDGENTFPSVLRCGLNPTGIDVARTQSGGTN